MVETVVPAGGFEDMSPYLILPEVTDPKSYRGGKLLYATTNPYILMFQGWVTSNVWVNRDVLPKSDFSTPDQLIEPRLRGKIAIRTLSAPHSGSLTLTGFLHNKGQDFVDKLLVDQQPTFIDNARLMTQDLINGKYAIGIGIDDETMDACQREGGCKNMELVMGDRYMLSYGTGILKNPPHPNAASIFLNWFFSKEGQQAFVKAMIDTTPPPYDQAHSIRADVDPHPDAIADGTLPDYDHLEQYSLQGTEAGGPEMQAVLAAYRRVEETGGH
jgi:iron(III) transport system substrate-binding protein